jgi:xylulokinase
MSAPLDRTALLGLDIGTTSCKLVAYAEDGRRLAQAAEGYPLLHPAPGWAELDPDAVLGAVRTVLGAVAPALAGFGRLAMAISAQGEAFVLVDADGRALSMVPVSVDMRGREAVAALRADPQATAAAEAAGQELTALTSLAKLLWFRHAPDRPLEHADQVLCVGEFVMRHLGLAPVMDHSMAARTGLLDMRQRCWSAPLLAAARLPARLFPPVAPAGTFVGTVPAERMATLGIDHAVEIYTGGHDQACAMLGAGVAGDGTALYSIGTTEAIGVPALGFPEGLGDLHIAPYPHVVDGRYVVLFGSQHGGRVLPWLAGLLGRDGQPLIPADLPAAPSRVVFVPHLAGSGTVLGDDAASASVLGLDYDTTPERLIHAALEGITLEQGLGLSRLAGHGIAPTRLRAVGGGTRSDAWMQMKADILGLPIDVLDEPDTACAGAAVLAGIGAGRFASAEAAAAQLVRVDRAFTPRPALHAVYALKLELYRRIYESTAALRPLEHALSAAIAGLAADTGESN